MKLRLYHHRDGARVAYRESGSGPPLALFHSAGLSHMEFEPIVELLEDRFRVVLPDLPLHGDSEERPRHPYTPDWFAEVLAGFSNEVLGPRPLLGGHGLGAEVLLRMLERDLVAPSRLILLPNRLHRRATHEQLRRGWRIAVRAAAVPGLDRALSHGARLVFRPDLGLRLSARGAPGTRDLLRHAFADVGGNTNRARSWARYAARWPSGPQRELFELYPRLSMPVLLLWADEDNMHPLSVAEEAVELIEDATLRVLPNTGYLIAYDDPAGVARELGAFCG
ncbi:MAG TPA: alpha/beta hydrolase [Solirubrobacteraceae bacterium]|nr:alpha/beta hydrolase [Solirubrobacteraceae bacterium]